MTGKIFIVGTGPGSLEYMSLRAINSIKKSDVIIGYKTYIKLIEDLTEGKELISSGMRLEVERCQMAVEMAEKGKIVCLISSGDAGIYGMAGIVLEIAAKAKSAIETEVVPGITSAISSASLVGAPLMNDFAVISLSDLMTPWEVIVKRIEKASEGDFVMSVYNPKSNERVEQIKIFRDIVLRHRGPETPVAIVKDAMRDKQHFVLCNLGNMLDFPIDMTTTLIIGNSQTYICDGKMITPRGYKY